MAEELSQSGLATLLGVTQQRISKAIQSGVLKKSVKRVKHGKTNRYIINKELALTEWAANIDPSKQRDPQKAAQTTEMNTSVGPGLSSYQKVKTMNEFYKSQLTKLEYDIKIGKFIPADIVKIQSFKLARRVRDAILGVPDRISPELAACSSIRKTNTILRDALSTALTELQDLARYASDTDRVS